MENARENVFVLNGILNFWERFRSEYMVKLTTYFT
jgi:hypothetical protein